MKTKSKLVLGLSILGAATLAAGTTSTFAWFTVTASHTGSGSSSVLAATTSAAAAGNLAFTFGLATSDSPKLTDTDGRSWYYPKGATPNAQGTGLIEYSPAAVTELYGTITISVTKIMNGENDITSSPGAYAGTYNFKVQVDSANGPKSRFGTTQPTTAANVGALGTADAAFTVVIGSDGNVDVAGLGDTDGDKIYFAITGDHTVGDGSEKAAFKVVHVE